MPKPPNSTVFLLTTDFQDTDFSRNIDEQVISVENLLPYYGIYTILQDRKGFMWFGMEEGLVRYDGYDFTFFKNEPDEPPSVSESNVRFLFEDSNGNIWVGTRGGGLNRFDPITERFKYYLQQVDNPNSLSNNYLNLICEDPFGYLWIGTDKGLNRFDPEEERFTHFFNDANDPNSLSHNDVNSVSIDSSGNLWIGTLGGGLNKLILPKTYTHKDYWDNIQFLHYKHDP